MNLYYHKTSGGAEYLTDTFIEVYCVVNTTDKEEKAWFGTRKNEAEQFASETNGALEIHREGAITPKTKYVVRIDGDITKDAELTVR